MVKHNFRGTAYCLVLAWWIFVRVISLFAANYPKYQEDSWPQLKMGTWRLTVVEKRSGRLKRRFTLIKQMCDNMDWWFKEYHGRGIVNEFGCEFESRKKAENVYELTTQCNLQNAKEGISQGEVVVNGDTAYSATILTKESGHLMSAKTITAKWIKDCKPN